MSVSGTYSSEFCLEGLPSDVHFIVLLESKLKVYCEDNVERGEATYALKSKPLMFCSETNVDKIIISDWEEIDDRLIDDRLDNVPTFDASNNCRKKYVPSKNKTTSLDTNAKTVTSSPVNGNQRLTSSQTKTLDKSVADDKTIGLLDSLNKSRENENKINSVSFDLASHVTDNKEMYAHDWMKDPNFGREVLVVTHPPSIPESNAIYSSYNNTNPSASTHSDSCQSKLIRHTKLQADNFATDVTSMSANLHKHSTAEQSDSIRNSESDTTSTLPNPTGVWNNATIEMKLNVKNRSEPPPSYVRNRRSKRKTLEGNNQTFPSHKKMDKNVKTSGCREKRKRKRKPVLSPQSFCSDLNDDESIEIAINDDNDDKDYVPEVPVKIVKFDIEEKRLISHSPAENIDVDDDDDSQNADNKFSIPRKGRKAKMSNSSRECAFTKIKQKRGRKPKIKPENNTVREENIMCFDKSRQHVPKKMLKSIILEENINTHIRKQSKTTDSADLETIDDEKSHTKVKKQRVKRERPVRNSFAIKRQLKSKDLDDSLVKIDTDGLDPKLIYAAKMLEKEKIKASRRIQVDVLDDHQDKYRIMQVVSTAQKDRGKSHEDKSYNSYECTVCGRFQCIVKEKMRVHVEQHINGDLECKKCGYMLSYVKEIIRHNAQVHKTDNAKLCNRMCELCGVTSSTPRGWKTHMSKVHNVPSFDCQHCELKFSSGNAVVLHTRDAHTDKNITCEKCGQVFVSRNNWSYHVVRCNGTRTDTHVCDQCGASLTTAIALRRHIRHNHEKERTHKCTLCPYTTCTIAALQKHINAHIGNKQHHCELCSFSCVQKYQLTSHMRTHNGDRPYKCDKCPYAVSWNVQLKAHKKVHDLPNAVHCSICGIVLKDSRSLSKHESKDHGDTVRDVGGSGTTAEECSNSSGNNFANPVMAMNPHAVTASVTPSVPITHVASRISQVIMSQVTETIVPPAVQDGHNAMDMRTFRSYAPLEAVADYQIKSFYQYGY